jgi:putative redox protein
MSSPAQPTAPAGPVVSRTEVTWRGERLFDAGPPGRTHRIDASAKQAPGPVETLLNAIATCSAVDVVDIMNKRKTPIERMTIHVTAERRSEAPRRVQHLEIEFRIDGTGLEREQVERAIHLSFERYCSVASSLAPDIVAEARLTLNGETFPAVRQQIWTARP